MTARTIGLGLALAGSLGVSGIADAEVIFDNGTPDYQLSAIGPLSDLTTQQAADNFELGVGKALVTDVHWWGAYSNLAGAAALPSDNFVIQVFESSGDVPNASPLLTATFDGPVTRVDTGNQPNQAATNIFAYSVDIKPLALSPNKEYFLSIANNISTDWFWSAHFYDLSDSSEVLGDAVVRNSSDAGSTWGSWNAIQTGYGGAELAFRLTVPEPTTLALFGLGLAGLGAMRRKKLVG